MKPLSTHLSTSPQARDRRMRLSALFAATLLSAGGAAAQSSTGLTIQMPVLPRIEGCNAPGGLVRIESSDEPGSAPYWCGVPPMCLTVASGAFNGTSFHCDINAYARREPRGNPAGLPGANGVRDPDDLTCQAGLYAGGRPVGGICPPAPTPPAPPPPSPSIGGSVWFNPASGYDGDAATLFWTGSGAAAIADVLACTTGYSSAGQPATGGAAVGNLSGGASVTCGVRFWDAGRTMSADASATMPNSSAVSGTPSPPPPPPACGPTEVWNPISGACVPSPSPPPAPAQCPAQRLYLPVYTYTVTSWVFDPINGAVDGYTPSLSGAGYANFDIGGTGAHPVGYVGTILPFQNDHAYLAGVSPAGSPYYLTGQVVYTGSDFCAVGAALECQADLTFRVWAGLAGTCSGLGD